MSAERNIYCVQFSATYFGHNQIEFHVVFFQMVHDFVTIGLWHLSSKLVWWESKNSETCDENKGDSCKAKAFFSWIQRLVGFKWIAYLFRGISWAIRSFQRIGLWRDRNETQCSQQSQPCPWICPMTHLCRKCLLQWIRKLMQPLLGPRLQSIKWKNRMMKQVENLLK